MKMISKNDLFMNAFNFSAIGMVIVAIDGKWLNVNPSLCKSLGYTKAELVKMAFQDITHPEDLDLGLNNLNEMLDGEIGYYQITKRYIRKNGNIVWGLLNVSLVKDKQDYPLYFIAQIQDITEQKIMEEMIRKNEAQYKSLIEHNPDAVFAIDLEGDFTLVNESCTRIIGYSEEEFLRMSFYPLLIGEDLEKTIDALNKVMQGDTATIDITLHKKTGKKVVVYVTFVPIMVDGVITGLYAVAKDITEQKRIAKELIQSEERYRALVESSPNAIVVHQDYHEIAKERIDLLNRNIPVGALEERYVLIDGSVIDVEVTAIPILYMDKPAFQVIIQDISRRKEMERALSKSQEQYRSVVESIKEVIFQTDLQGRLTFLNLAWEKITGFTTEESIGKYFYDYVNSEDRESYHVLFQSLIQGEREYFRIEVRYVTKEAGYYWVEVYARVVINEQGVVIGTLGTLNNITKRKAFEEGLKASEERFRLIAEYSSDLITIHDLQRKYIYVSPVCKEILQYDEKELIKTDAFSFVHQDERDMVIEQLQTLFETGYIVVTFRIRRKDGAYVWLESACKLLNDIDGDGMIIAVSRSINERKIAEQKLQEANEILQRLSAIDGLTGVANRRAFDERLEVEWNFGRRNSSLLSLIMLDIDFFKAYNDTYGHQGGDSCLKQIASVINETLGRSTDFLCRYGGEEFCIILPDTDEAGAKVVGEKVRKAIEKLEIPHAGSVILPWVTISVGTATMILTVYTSSQDLISKADKALYKAKSNGRNCFRSF